jgi:hypothetical protein
MKFPLQLLRYRHHMQPMAPMLKHSRQKSGGQALAENMEVIDNQPGFLVTFDGAQGLAGFPDAKGVWETGFKQTFPGPAIDFGYLAAEPLIASRRGLFQGREPARAGLLRTPAIQIVPHGRGFAVA